MFSSGCGVLVTVGDSVVGESCEGTKIEPGRLSDGLRIEDSALKLRAKSLSSLK